MSAFFQMLSREIRAAPNKKKSAIVSFLRREVLPVNEQAMENPNASELVEKLAKGEISRREFDLFLKMLDDKKLTGDLDKGLLALFNQYLNECNSDEKKDETQ